MIVVNPKGLATAQIATGTASQIAALKAFIIYSYNTDGGGIG